MSEKSEIEKILNGESGILSDGRVSFRFAPLSEATEFERGILACASSRKFVARAGSSGN